ncbi:MAG: hypothetical protein DRH03_00720 [Deltaproteobacteria bacterium]|nr:MAG: hypothetical protein DRH03_00720 [Deltaproteobacteria bacterium]
MPYNQLQIDDVAGFLEVLTNGIGSAKGCGLLSLVRT